MTSKPATNTLSLKRQPDGAATLLAALEQGWLAIRDQHPDVPIAQVIVAQGSGQRGSLVLGHFAPDRWQATEGNGELVHELLIGGEGLATGAEDVFGTQLHEAAHALAIAIARGIADTSRDGRYHNHHYRQLAEELGLSFQRDAQLGWSTTSLPDATCARYATVIAVIAAAITRHRLPEPTLGAGRNLRAATCACPRRIRVAPSTLLAGEITCAICRKPFTTPPAGQGVSVA